MRHNGKQAGSADEIAEKSREDEAAAAATPVACPVSISNQASAEPATTWLNPPRAIA
jgi:hypothetical protein